MSLTDQQRLSHLQQQPRAVLLWLELQKLRSCISFMNTGAHPDDETSPMLAALGLRDGVKLSHACATRGEGGQNALGLEVSKDLGVVRTREMERAAAVLGMTQYWLSETPQDSIFDFGFSKSGDETLGIWGEKRTLARFVLILRMERPDIICPTFLDIPGQHGHHRAMTRSAFKAVELAPDPNAFPDQGLDPWQVKKLYLPAWSGAGDAYDDDEPPPPANSRVDATGADPVLGADYAQIGQCSRAHHKTQQMGRWIDAGQQSPWPLNLAFSTLKPIKSEPDIFVGLPKTLAELADFANAPELNPLLCKTQNELDAAIAAWPDQGKIIAHASAALGLIRQVEIDCPSAARDEILHRLTAKEKTLSNILHIANNITCRISLLNNEVRPGQKTTLQLNMYSPDIAAQAQIVAPEGWQVSSWDNQQCTVTIPHDASPSDCYRDIWYPDRANGPVHLKLSWLQGKLPVSITRDIEQELLILPGYSASVIPNAALLNIGAPEPVSVSVGAQYPNDKAVCFEEQKGWTISGEGRHFTLMPDKDIKPGLYSFPLSIEGKPARTIHAMNYRHTAELARFEPCVLNICALDIALPKAKIAYIGGGSDSTDHWLRAIGMKVISLDDDQLQQTDFSEFDSVIVGIFALRTRAVLARRLSVLHHWVRQGGNLVSLYHRPWDNWQPDVSPLAPLTIGKPSLRWRVTDENAEITHLVPDHPLLNFPNKISPVDWQGWQKERGLYFASDWDAQYVPLLSMADPGEKPLTGALLSGVFGKGRHTHTSLILHYQLEKLVPGAYRLLANLLGA